MSVSRIRAICLIALGCSPVASGPNDVIAIEVRSPTSVQLIVGDTITLQAVAITANGAEASEVQILWGIIDIDSGQIGFTLDTLTGFVQAQGVGNGRVQARVENLRADPLTVNIAAPPTPELSRNP
jgi:hypothetical protein